MTETYLPRAEAAGARLLTGHRVDRLVLDGGRAVRAELTTADGRHGTIDFRARLRLRRRDPDAGAAAALRAAPRHRPHARRAPDREAGGPLRRRRSTSPTTSPCTRSRSSPPTCRSAARRPDPGLVALALSDSWDRFRLGHRGLAPAGRVLRGDHQRRARAGSCAVPGLRDPLVTYRLTRRDRDLLGQGLARLALLMLEAGATEVYPSYRGAPVVRRRCRPGDRCRPRSPPAGPA